MWFRVAIDRLVVALLPGFLRNPALAAFIQALVYPIAKLYDTWRSWREQNLYKLRHTGQVGSLRQALNDGLDPEERRIDLADTDSYTQTYIYTPAEKKPQYLGEVYVHSNMDYTYDDVDFIIHIPSDIAGHRHEEVHYLYTPAEQKPVYLGELYLYGQDRDDHADWIIDFTETTQSKKLFELKTLLDFYKPASKRYKILAYE